MIEERGLLVALGCPGPSQCNGYWPRPDMSTRHLYDYELHLERHTRERLGLGEDDEL